MFDTLGSFSVLFFVLAAALILLVVFEKQCLTLEDRFDEKMRKIKQAKKQERMKKVTAQKPHSQAQSHKSSSSYRRTRNYAA